MANERLRSDPNSLIPSPLAVALRGRRSPEPLVDRLLPFVRTIREYRLQHLRPDLVAGLTTALFAIPQAMAYAMIAGFPPSSGIATAVVASILGAAFGSSEFLINGPTNAISVMLAANAALFAAHGDPVKAVVMLTFVMGVVQIVSGMARAGTLTRFVSEPVLIGFTAGAGLYIVINQLPAFLGIDKASIAPDLWGYVPPSSALFDLARVLRSLDHVHIATAALALFTFVTVRAVQRLERPLGRRLPAPFIAVVLATFAVVVLGLDGADAAQRVKIVSDIEPLTRHFPALRLPTIDFAELRFLAGPAIAIGLMGSVEAIAIGKSLAGRAGHAFDASRQLIGEGFCNVGAALVGGFASSGSFSRTAVNFEAGAVTRISCILSGVLVLVIVFMFAPQANLIPIAALAGTLVHIGFKLVDVGRLRAVYETTTADRIVLLVTFAGVLLVEHLENALFIGIGVSIYFALRRAEGFKLRVLVPTDDGSWSEIDDVELSRAPEVLLLNLQGELFFAAAEELQLGLLRVLDSGPRVIVLRVQEAYNIDATTAAAIVHVAEQARRRAGRLLLCGVRPGMYGTFERTGLLAKLGEDNVFRADRELLGSTRRAMAHAEALASELGQSDP
jgi:sulfate permease, SulP family